MQMLLAMVLLTACNNDDDNNQAKNTGPGPLAEELSAGTWYNIYEATGVAHAEGAREESMAYSVVADVYHFNTDGTGDFQRCFFGDDDDDILVQGILGYGVFNYSSTADGKVHITLTHQWDQSYPQQWDVSYANEAVNAKGVDGQELKLLLADEGMQAVLNRMAEQNGSSDYDVDAYKPKGIDNSQWMKTLADSRLVADLSLPGSHDACTAEGWQSKLFRFIAEASAKTQELTIREQLKVGMRVFDLRPERVFESTSYVLRCSHGVMSTQMLVNEFFQQLKDFLAANPTEFCIVTVDLSATSDKNAWGKEFTALLSSDAFKRMFANFKPRLTVGEMRGKVLILSKIEFAKEPIGGFCYGWVDDKELDKQTKGHITGPNGVEAPLWVQDYWGKSSRDGKDDAVIRMLEAAANRDMNAESPAWVINFPSAYFGLPLSDSYRENAVEANKVTADWLASHTGSVGIIYVDFAGMDKTPGYASLNLYDTHGMTLVDCVIKQNMK